MISPLRLSEETVLLEIADRNFKETFDLLRIFPPAEADTRHDDCSFTARELAWAFVLRTVRVSSPDPGPAPAPPESWTEILYGLERSYRDCRQRLLTAFEGRQPAARDGHNRTIEMLWEWVREQPHHRHHFALHLRRAEETRRARAPAASSALMD